MPLRDLNDARHWRDRAAEMRALADNYLDNDTARIMRTLAKDYDRLADRAETRAKAGHSPLDAGRPGQKS